MPAFLLEAAGIGMPVCFTDSHKIQLLSIIHLSDYCSAIFILTRRKTGSIVKTKKPESFCFSDSIWIYLEAGLLHTLCAWINISLSQPVPLDKNAIRRGRKFLGKYPTLIHILLCVHTQYVCMCSMTTFWTFTKETVSKMTVKTITSGKSYSPCVLWRIRHCGSLMITRNREKLTAFEWIMFLQ